MKKIFLTLFLAILATTGLYAQQISVVSPGGDTDIYWTLPEAINGAEPGSVIYLPGGGFTISDDVKITKKLTIIGIGHYSKSGNVDGVTNISGNLFFNEGSSGSAVMGSYITGNVNIGDDGTAVNNVLIRYCNLKSLKVKKLCKGTVLNQNYIREIVLFNYNAGEITNNFFQYINYVDGGVISNNIVTYSDSSYPLNYISNSSITGNIFLQKKASVLGNASNNSVSGNMVFRAMQEDEDVVDLTGIDYDDVFVNYNNSTISPASDFHFKEAYKQYENQVGIYAGTGFNDQQIAPVPYIVAKRVDEQTDASGKLNVKIRVKAGD